MPRVNRVDVGDQIYHVLNRANARAQVFDNDNDYQLFESILEEAQEKFEALGSVVIEVNFQLKLDKTDETLNKNVTVACLEPLMFNGLLK